MNRDAGEALRKLRRSADVTQRELAARLGVTDSAVSEWERGQSTPSRSNAAGADEALGAGGAVLAIFGYSAQREHGGGDRDETTAALTRRVDELQAKVDLQEERLGWLIRRLSIEDVEAMNAAARPEQFGMAAEGSTGEPRSVGRRVNRPSPPVEG